MKRIYHIGFSLLEALIALGVVSAVGLAFMRLTENQFKTQTKVANRADMIDVRQEIKQYFQSEAICSYMFKSALGNPNSSIPATFNNKSVPSFNRCQNDVCTIPIYKLNDPALNANKFNNKFRISSMTFNNGTYDINANVQGAADFKIDFEFCPSGGVSSCHASKRLHRSEIIKGILRFESVDGKVASIKCKLPAEKG